MKNPTKARFYLDVEFAGRAGAEGMATALDNVKSIGMTSLSGCWGEYFGEPRCGEFFVLDTAKALQFATDLDTLIDDGADERGTLGPIRDFLRQIGTVK